ncbi:MAG: bifunctional UDP-N-acetylglucosamine diphosphorylase/glucosamine-1-phosphate N-acetyltransferase GlmU [Hyphomicrobiales bacterium]
MAEMLLAVVLAAGEGTRMRSNLPKVLHEVGGLPMVGHVIRAIELAGCDNVSLVVGNGAKQVEEAASLMKPGLETYVQSERFGTAHAVLAAKEAFADGTHDIIIGYGDTPLVTPELFASVINALEQGADVAVLGFEAEDPTGYGRLLMDGETLSAIREEKDASAEERRVTFCNSGIMGLKAKHALSLLEAIGNDNVKGEYYLTDAVEIARERGLNVRAVSGREEDTLGVNNRVELSQAEAIYQDRRRTEFMLEGVTLTAPDTVHFSFDTKIGRDTIIEPNCYFAPGVQIADGAIIKANSYLEGDLKKGLLVEVAAGAQIGPYARLRPGANIHADAKVGNFCEVKNAIVARGAKINHLTYIGDAELGEGANIGAGTITCNYDGYSKFKTIVGAGAFIGSNSSLVAPVTVADGAYVGSGSVITKDVSADALAIARGKQIEKSGWARTFRAKAAKK